MHTTLYKSLHSFLHTTFIQSVDSFTTFDTEIVGCHNPRFLTRMLADEDGRRRVNRLDGSILVVNKRSVARAEGGGGIKGKLLKNECHQPKTGYSI